VGALLRHYDRIPGRYPVVRLQPGGFNHRDPRVGWVPVPNFPIVGQVTQEPTTEVPDTSVATAINDEIPF
jgi:hypothetical protein